MSVRDAVAERDVAAVMYGKGGPARTIQEKLLDFHFAMNVPTVAKPAVPADDRVRLRARLIVEECFELLEASFHSNDTAEGDLTEAMAAIHYYIENAPVRVDLPLAADALADIAYVVEGANLEFGIDSGPVLDEVHRANMAKVGGPVRADGKCLKPEGWTPPDIARVLAEQSK